MALSIISLSFAAGCNNEVVEPRDHGEYVFLEKTILTSAVLVEGNPSFIPVICVEPGMFYEFDGELQTLSYRSGEPFPVSRDLKVIVADNHFYLWPLAGCNGGTIWLNPVYFFPHWIDTTFRISGVSSDFVQFGLAGIPTEIHLPTDSTFVHVTTRLDSVLQFDDNWAILRFTDSLSITNYGLQPNEKVVWTRF